VSARFRQRGLIEGFYGPPWTHRDRLDLLGFCGQRGMNAYVYAPKNDPKHRKRWREPYSDHELERFRELERHCRDLGMSFGFAISPGLDIDYGSADDRATLSAKLRTARDLGVGWLVVAFDDLPGRAAQGDAQGELMSWLYDELGGRDQGLRLSVVPTEYAGVTGSRYLSQLADRLPDDVDVAWTGRWVVSPTITLGDARARAAALGGRPPLLWDNYPVTDNHMSRSLFLGPYTGRDPGLGAACSGVLCNPMPLAHASKVALATAAEFFADPVGYVPGEAWQRAIDAVGNGHAPVLAVLAGACSDSALAAVGDMPCHRLLDRYEAGEVPLTDLVEHFLPAGEAAALVAGETDPVWDEVRPWLAQMNLEARAGLAALRVLVALELGYVERVADAAVGLQVAWDRARGGAPLNLFGPRFASYPVTTCTPDGDHLVDLTKGIVEDASAIDRLCRLASRAYVSWRDKPRQEVVGL
jgi:hyaluronoglucosaminidase